MSIHNIDMDDIDYALFRRLDLNLLVALDALVAERSVSRAAARLYLGQPAMSHALARLRALLGDDVLYREGAGMAPTERAQALAPRVRQFLMDAQAIAVAQAGFNPALATGRFQVALNDPLETLLLPHLVASLRVRAPGLTLSVRPIPASLQLEELDRGEIRLAAGYFPKLRDVHEQTLLYRSGFSCVYNPALIQPPRPITLEGLTALPHIHTSYTGDMPGLVDRAFQQRKLKRRVVAQTATPLSIPFVVKQSPLLAVLPDLVTRLFRSHDDLRCEPLSVEGLELPIAMVAHRRNLSDPLTTFIKGEIIEAARTVFGGDTT